MDIQFYIHGVPGGFDFLGDTKDKDLFLRKFYDKKGINEFRVDAINRGGKLYFYYTYMLANNISDNKNKRGGSYFGLTVRLDQYYRKVLNLYFLLDSFFYSFLFDSLLYENNGGLVYSVPSFENINTSFDNLKGLMEQTFSERDFQKLKSEQKTEYELLNISDATDDSVCNLMKKVGHVSLSMSHLTNQACAIKDEKEAEIAKIKETHSAELEVEYNKNESLLSSNNELDKQLQEEKASHEATKNELKNKEAEIEKLTKKASKYDDILLDLKAVQIKPNSSSKNAKNNALMGNVVYASIDDISKIVSDSKDGILQGVETFFSVRDSHKKNVNILKLIAPIIVLLSVIGSTIYIANKISKIGEETCQTLNNLSVVCFPNAKTDNRQDSSNDIVENINQDLIIDFAEYNKSKQFAGINENIHISLKPRTNSISVPTIGYWDCSDGLKVGGESATNAFVYSDRPGDYEVYYKIDNTIVAKRSICVK